VLPSAAWYVDAFAQSYSYVKSRRVRMSRQTERKELTMLQSFNCELRAEPSLERKQSKEQSSRAAQLSEARERTCTPSGVPNSFVYLSRVAWTLDTSGRCLVSPRTQT
jgi:hypothetical protein